MEAANYPIPRFDDPELCGRLLADIKRLANRTGPVKIMEVCGTHTMEIGRLGLRSILPTNVELLSGPGCPVCVTPGSMIDALVALADGKTHVLTYGDMIRVPGDNGSLEQARARGGKVSVVSSALEAVKMAKRNLDEEFVFAAVGFETTAPATARAVVESSEFNLQNLSFLLSHRILPPGLSALANDGELAIAGFMLPGHVSAILGMEPYRLLEELGIPAAVTGFEPVDILFGIQQILRLIADKSNVVYNAYPRVVRPEGNPAARQLMEKVFEICDAEWRGIGTIPQSGQRLKKEFAQFDAECRTGAKIKTTSMPKGCSCGDVLKGKRNPTQCPLFGKGCTPESPLGPCMVSSEGSCAAYYRYG